MTDNPVQPSKQQTSSTSAPEDNLPKLSSHLDDRYRQQTAGVVILIVSELEKLCFSRKDGRVS